MFIVLSLWSTNPRKRLATPAREKEVIGNDLFVNTNPRRQREPPAREKEVIDIDL